MFIDLVACISLQTLNYDLTRSLLDLVVLYASIMILVGQIDSRRAIAGTFIALVGITSHV